jgi:hypothetical protein
VKSVCSCAAATYLDNNICKDCPTNPPFATDDTPDGACTCDDATSFIWNATAKNCICKTGNFLDTDGTTCK